MNARLLACFPSAIVLTVIWNPLRQGCGPPSGGFQWSAAESGQRSPTMSEETGWGFVSRTSVIDCLGQENKTENVTYDNVSFRNLYRACRFSNTILTSC